MQAPDDKILHEVYNDLKGAQHTESYFIFFKQLKEKYPETVLYGTERGFFSTGKRYLNYLKENGLENSIKYELAVQCMQQGQEAVEKIKSAHTFARQKRLENFIAAKKRTGISQAICCIQYCDLEPGDINLYEEPLNVKQNGKKVYEKWGSYYQKGHRILFEDGPYYVAEFLNMYMQAPDDKILYEVADDIKEMLFDVKDFLYWTKKVKEDYPETVYCGIDIGWGDAAGARYLKYLKDKGLEDSINYKLASKCIAQKKEWSDYFKLVRNSLTEFYEQKMVENFMDAYKRAGVSEVVGIYENSYVDPTKEGNMEKKKKKHYGDIVEGIYIKDSLQKDKQE